MRMCAMELPAFATPVTLLPTPPALPRAPCSRRAPPTALNSGGGAGVGGLGRLPEWGLPGGDRALQDQLAADAARLATRARSSAAMDDRIADGMAGVSELLEGLYRATERDLAERNAHLARRESIPQVSKWNRTLMDSDKASRQARIQILAELAEVRSLLRRTNRSRHPRMASRRRARIEVADDIPTGVCFTAGVTALVLGSFENVAARESGPEHLAQLGSVSLLLVLLGAHFTAGRDRRADRDP